MGGRSLRCTAQLIYGDNCQSGVFSDGPEDDLRSATEVEIERKLGCSPRPEKLTGKMLNNVGGDKLWRCLCEKLLPRLGLGDESDDYDFDDDFFHEEDEEEEEEVEKDGSAESDGESRVFVGSSCAPSSVSGSVNHKDNGWDDICCRPTSPRI